MVSLNFSNRILVGGAQMSEFNVKLGDRGVIFHRNLCRNLCRCSRRRHGGAMQL